VVKVDNNGDRIKLNYWCYPNYEGYRINTFRFADGTVLTAQELLAKKPVFGIDGNDAMFRIGSANDWFDGSAGADTLTGGADADTFLFDTEFSSAANVDSISDLIAGLDKIGLDKEIFTALKNEDQGSLLSDYFRASTNGLAADENDYFLYNTTTGALFYDADGSGQGVATQFATLTTKPTLSASDFVITSLK
jgi:Ca2+-binding RTX toxin-like protein